MQHVVMPGPLTGHLAFERRLTELRPVVVDADVLLDLTESTFVRPSGLAHLIALIFTLVARGYRITVQRPSNANVDAYMRRTDFWGLLRRAGLTIPEEWVGWNLGRASGLIECQEIPTRGTVQSNLDQTGILFDQFLRSFGRERPETRISANLWSEICNNAAEHSQSANGAFVVAQRYQNAEIEIAIVDVGRGIRASLAHFRYETDRDAIGAAVQEGITGRTDAAGNPAEGGYGLWIARREASELLIRSGSALFRSTGSRDEEKSLNLVAEPCFSLLGTLVVAKVRVT